jgi:Mce-associated membrane protein
MSDSNQIEEPAGVLAGRSRMVLGVAVLLALAVVAGLLAFLLLRDDDSATTSDGLVDAGALVAARQEAVAFFSLDYRHAADDVAKVLSLATGDFKKQYATNQKSVIAQVKAKKLVTTATIPQSSVAVEFASGSQARILVVVDVTRTIGTTTDSLRNRARIILERHGDRWLVSGVNQVG